MLFFTGQICPTCGSTRAILSLLRGNFKMYVSYQPMAIPLVIAVVLCIHLQFIKKPLKEISAAIVGATLFLNTVFYILRL
ncbi:DUF2752 domain-containing protein [Oscillospiraceae bacterium BX1]|uniref:DUF2752 domain-containing protein n=1 Tax=Yanshouia hominis TaxID=2763673 RepID=A0ABR7NIW3_9FIRM|nr:DUF2752 domain-containing protein [Yanshouia hominis]